MLYAANIKKKNMYVLYVLLLSGVAHLGIDVSKTSIGVSGEPAIEFVGEKAARAAFLRGSKLPAREIQPAKEIQSESAGTQSASATQLAPQSTAEDSINPFLPVFQKIDQLLQEDQRENFKDIYERFASTRPLHTFPDNQTTPQAAQPRETSAGDMETTPEQDLTGYPWIVEFVKGLRDNYVMGEAFEILLSLEETDLGLRQRAQVKNEKANLLMDAGLFQEASESYQEAFLVFQELEEWEALLVIYNNLAALSQSLEDYERALRYYTEAVKLVEEHGLSSVNVILLYINKGTVHRRMKEQDEALFYYQLGMKQAEAANQPMFMAQGLLNLGNLYKDMGLYKQSLKQFTESLKISRREQILVGPILNFTNMASLYQTLENYTMALAYLDSARMAMKGLTLPLYERTILDYYKVIYEKMGVPDSASYYAGLVTSIDDSLFSAEQKNEALMDQTRFEILQMQRRLNEKSDEVSMWKSRQSRLTAISLSVFGLMIVLIGFLVQRDRRNQQKYKRVMQRLKEVEPSGWQPMHAELDQRVDGNGQGSGFGSGSHIDDDALDGKRDASHAEDGTAGGASTRKEGKVGVEKNGIGLADGEQDPKVQVAESTMGGDSIFELPYEQTVDFGSLSERQTKLLEIYHMITDLFEHELLFRDPLLTLDMTALKAATNKKYVSLAIKEFSGMSFSDFTNSYRVKDACRLFTENQPTPMSMVEVMEQSGFRTRATFYRVFRQFTDMTPSQFRKQAKKDKGETSKIVAQNQ